MIIIFKKGFKNIQQFKDQFLALGLTINQTIIDDQIILKLTGNTYLLDDNYLSSFAEIEKIVRLDKSYDLVKYKGTYKNVKVKDITIGNDSKFCVIAGPCSVENYDAIANTINNLDFVSVIRGGAFKPRKSPYAFQGLGRQGIEILKEIGTNFNKPIISEILYESDIDYFVENVDIIQVGARNMSNFSLLKLLGKTNKPILLKRGPSSTIEEWLLAAEYIVKEGNENVILCERGIKTFENATRNTLDLSAVALVKKLSNLPVIVDPSHATGRFDLVCQMAIAAMAAGADGIMLEVSQGLEGLKSDGSQTISTKRYNELLKKLAKVAEALDRAF